MSRVEPRHELWYGTGLGGPKYRAGLTKYTFYARGVAKSPGTKVPGWEGPKYRAGRDQSTGLGSQSIRFMREGSQKVKGPKYRAGNIRDVTRKAK